jgi:hypothetical protein
MVRQCGLQLISKLRSDAEWYMPYVRTATERGTHRKYEERIQYGQLPAEFLKQTWVEKGIETCDFMNIRETPVTNAANLSLFMVNVSAYRRQVHAPGRTECSVLDLKAYYRGTRYVTEILKMLPQKPTADFLPRILQRVAEGGRVLRPAVQAAA